MSQDSLFPTGEALKAQVKKRHRSGTFWRILFQASTIIGIVALTALLYNIINESFGLVAVEYARSPESLVLAYEEERLLSASNTFSSEDDNELAAAIQGNPHAIGFFGYAYYQNSADSLKLLSVDGVTPTAATVESGEYPLARPLFLYSTADIMQQNQAVNIFLNYYLNHANAEIEAVGYFPISPAVLSQAQLNWIKASGFELQPGQWADVNPAGLGGTFSVVGSSTVFPLTEQILARIGEAGFTANVRHESIGSTAGFRAFCVNGTADIVAASRPITPAEFSACEAIGRVPVEMRVGTDALAVVTSQENNFVSNVSRTELRQLFTEATTWSEVNEAWPETAVFRTIPGIDSGTLDFFAETIFPASLAELPKDTLVALLADTVSSGVGRRLEREQRFYDDRLIFESEETWATICTEAEPPAGCTAGVRDQEDVYNLVVREVVAPDVLASWPFLPSLFNRDQIVAEATLEYPAAVLQFRSWISSEFLTNPQSSTPEVAGIRTAILGSLWVVAITILFSFPVGVGAAIYLEEYATENRLNRIIQTNINNLAGVPSIIYGMLGLAIFVRTLEAFTSGSFLSSGADTTANGRTIISAGLTLGLLILPVIIIAGQEAIRAVPNSLRQAGMALGATKWQTIWAHVLPSALPGILTGTILAISRAIGETAPLVVVGASTFIAVDPSGPFSKFTVLPIQIYQWTARPQDEFRNIAAAAIIVLLVLLLTLNATAVLLRNRYARRA